MVDPTYILTAELDEASFAWLDDLRRTHFPPARNVLSAHLTMFHLLSSAQVERLSAMPLPSVPIELTFDRLRFLGAGVAYSIQSPDLLRLRGEITAAMAGDLSRQDSQKWTPHVTVQNKVAADTARKLFAELGESFVVRGGRATGLQVFEYLGGPWKLARRLPFESPRQP